MRGGFGGSGGAAEPPWAREGDREYHQPVGDSGRGRTNSTSRGISSDNARGAHPVVPAAAAAVDWRGGGGVAPASMTAPWATDYDLPGERQIGVLAGRDQKKFSTTDAHHQNHGKPEHSQPGRDMQTHHQRGSHHQQPPHGGSAWEGERHHHQQTFDTNNHGSAASLFHGNSGQGERHQRSGHGADQDDDDRGVGMAPNSEWKRPATMAPSWVRGGGQDLIVPSPSQGRKVQETLSLT